MVTTPRLAYQDYADLEGDERHELLDGELVLAPSPNFGHQEVLTNLGTSPQHVCEGVRPGTGLLRAHGCGIQRYRRRPPRLPRLPSGCGSELLPLVALLDKKTRDLSRAG